MTVFKALSEDEVASYRLNTELVRYLEIFCSRYRLDKGRVRVLDWGCGRGEAVAHLQRLGYQAAGADVDAESIDNGRHYFASAGTPAGISCLHVIGSDGRLDAPDGSFDFVFSETVLEHVVDLDAVARELGRLTARPSFGLHIFPSHRGVVEDHLHMPFIHWLPKNRLRRWAMYPYVAAGIEPRWVEEGIRNKVRRYYEYSLQHTFYRSPQEICDTFRHYGFLSCLVSGEHPRVARHPVLGPMLHWQISRRAISWALTNFKVVELLLEKPRT